MLLEATTVEWAALPLAGREFWVEGRGSFLSRWDRPVPNPHLFCVSRNLKSGVWGLQEETGGSVGREC